MYKNEKFLSFAIVFAVVLMVMVGVMNVMAADQMLQGKISTAMQRISKNGEAYVLLTIPESKELNGVKYNTETSVFCFKSEPAKKLKAGDDVKLIVKKSTDKTGNEFVTLIHIVK